MTPRFPQQTVRPLKLMALLTLMGGGMLSCNTTQSERTPPLTLPPAKATPPQGTLQAPGSRSNEKHKPALMGDTRRITCMLFLRIARKCIAYGEEGAPLPVEECVRDPRFAHREITRLKICLPITGENCRALWECINQTKHIRYQ